MVPDRDGRGPSWGGTRFGSSRRAARCQRSALQTSRRRVFRGLRTQRARTQNNTAPSLRSTDCPPIARLTASRPRRPTAMRPRRVRRLEVSRVRPLPLAPPGDVAAGHRASNDGMTRQIARHCRRTRRCRSNTGCLVLRCSDLRADCSSLSRVFLVGQRTLLVERGEVVEPIIRRRAWG